MGAIRGWLGRGALAGAACLALALPAAAQGADPVAVFKDIAAGSASSNAGGLTRVGDTLFFVADDGTTGVELYKTDGTAAGTTLVEDLNPGGAGSSPDQLTAAGGLLFFVADDGSGIGAELYRSDGTAAGTTLVKDVRPGPSTSSIDNLTAVGGSVFFSADDGAGAGFELFRSDGTAAGTGLHEDINPSGGSFPDQMLDLGGELWFTAFTPAAGSEPYTSNSFSTTMIEDLFPGTTGSSPLRATVIGDSVYMRAFGPGIGSEPFISDGTAAGTGLIEEINPGPGNGTPAGFTALDDDTAVFEAFDPALGDEPYVSSGTAATTSLLADVNPGSASGNPLEFIAADGKVFFSAVESGFGVELYRTDGTSAGTARVADLNPGAPSSQPILDSATEIDGEVFFRATRADVGAELFRTDGTAAGTTLVKEINPGTVNFPMGELVNFGNRLFFGAIDPTAGFELFAGLPVPEASPTAVAFPQTEAGDTSPTSRITVANDGPGPMQISAISLSGDDALDFAVADDNCTGIDASFGDSCSIDVAFEPESEGAKGAELEIESNATDSPTLVQLSGTGVVTPADTAAPQTTLEPVKRTIKARKGKKKARVTFRFSADDATATFECSIDDDGFAPCKSPRSAQFRKGRHSFAVRSTDAAGNADATPASAEFRVKVNKKRKKRK
jgi:ELWxxDGT repeat protein